METIRATVSRIIFFSEDSGYKVLSTRTQDGKVHIVTGEFGPEIIPETIADFHGDYKTHPKYGNQFRTKAFTLVHNAEEMASIRLYLDNIAPNIGAERSESIVDYFKMDLIKILDESPQRLLEVPGIGKVSAESLTKAWQENRQKWNDERQIYSLRAFLGSLGLKERRVKRVLLYFHGREFDAEQIIKENPYRLIEIEGFGFSTVDFISRRLGVPESAPERMDAFILYCLEITCPENGHLFMTLSDLLESVNEYCQENNTKFLGTSITEWDINRAIQALLTEQKLILDDDRIYSKKYYQFEMESATILARIMTEKSDLIFLTKKTIDDHIIKFEHESGIVLSEEQKQALYCFAEQKVFVITGFPGSGKTTILKAIVQLVTHLGLKLTCMTPTGIAAKKLSSTINYDAYTIHRRLGYLGNSWEYNEIKKFETDVLIIDEASMLDQEVFYRMLAAVRNRVHIIFVGDHNQLPSVGAGNVLRELIQSNQIPIIRLEKIFRQDEGSDIIQASHDVMAGDTSLTLFKNDPKADIFFMRVKEIPEIERIVVGLSAKFKDERRLFQIITPRNTGPLSVDTLNKLLQETLNPPLPFLKEINCGAFIIRVGDRVIIKKNDYQNEIYNGDIGKVITVGGGVICIKIDDRLIDIPVDEIDEKIKLSYALTVHKMQGLEYPTIILLMINQHGKNLLQRNLLYTAITRAKKKVIVIGHGSALERAINNTSVIRRNTILGERIRKCLEQKKKASSCTSHWELETYLDVTPNKEQSLSEIENSSPMDLIEE